jgi:tight adherence protein B
MLAGLVAIGFGILVLVASVMTAGSRGPRDSMEDRILAYGAGPQHSAVRPESAPALDQAKDAAAKMLHRNRGLENRISTRLEAAGSAFKPAEWLLMHAAIALTAGLAGLLLGGGGFFMMLLGLVLGVVIPWFYLGFKRKRRVKRFNAGLADTLQLMSGSLSAGLSLAQSVDTVVREGNDPIASEFKRVLIETRLGVSLEEAMASVAERMGSKDFEWVVMAIGIQRQVGGNLAELLNTVAGTLRERDYLRRQVASLSAEGKLSGYILGGMPIAMLIYMQLVRPEYVKPLFTTMAGYGFLAAAAFLLLFGGFIMSRIVKVEV